MKTAISIPDDVFDEAEAFASEQNLTRSRLFTMAVREYVHKRKTTNITKRLNSVYESEDSALDTELEQMQSASLPKDDWN